MRKEEEQGGKKRKCFVAGKRRRGQGNYLVQSKKPAWGKRKGGRELGIKEVGRSRNGWGAPAEIAAAFMTIEERERKELTAQQDRVGRRIRGVHSVSIEK